MITTVRVGSAPRACDVQVGSRLIDKAGERLASLAPGGRVSVLTDRGVADHHGERLSAAVEAGGLACELIVAEEASGPPALELAEGDLVALFGGGSVERAAPALKPLLARGVRLARLPTTLWAQVDAVTRAPEVPSDIVLADLEVLATLPAEAARAGIGLGLRHALAADARLFTWIEGHLADLMALRAPGLAHLIAGCAELTTPLPLGEDIAAALRAEAPGIGAVEAGALGCALAFRLSTGLGLCDVDAAERATWAIAAAGLPVRLEEVAAEPSASAVVRRLSDASGVSLVLTHAVGRAFRIENLDPVAVADLLVAEGCLP